ncbi:MAG: ABC transporter ATP-binding protein [bacterium]
MAPEEKIVFNRVSKAYDGFEAVKDLSLRIMEGETLVLIGTSGCGKTTTLKMINRLIEPTKGTIEIDGHDVSTYDPILLRRQIGYVIQPVGLFPHMTIGENIAVVPELLKWPKGRVASRTDRLLEMVGLAPEEYRHRYPAELSGGQRQRIGVARALAADPPVVLMDEPFGALDPITRETIQNEFTGLARKIEKTIVFVTHDIFEAVKIADRLAVMDQGRIIQVGPPKEIVERPRNDFVLDFLGRHHFQLALLLTPVDEIMHPLDPHDLSDTHNQELPSLDIHATILDALNYYKHNKTDRIIISREDGQPQGILTRDLVVSRVFAALEDHPEGHDKTTGDARTGP